MRPSALVASLGSALRWEGLLPAVLVVLAAAVIVRFVRVSTGRAAARSGARRPWVQRTGGLVQLGVIVLAAAAAASLALRWETGAAALVVTALALAVGLALRDVVSSLLATAWVLLERPLQVGDRASVGGYTGEVVAIGVRAIRLRTDDGALVTVPTTRLWHEVVRCENHGTVEVPVAIDLLVAIDQDLERARRDLEQAARSSQLVHPGHPIEVTVAPFHEAGAIGIRLRLRAHAVDGRRREAFVSDVTLRATAAFREHAIRPPSPARPA